MRPPEAWNKRASSPRTLTSPLGAADLTLGMLLRALWAILFLWYVVERLRTVKEQVAPRPIWHHPIAAARRFWGALRAVPGLAWRVLAGGLAAQVVACLARLLWHLCREGYPADLGAASVRAMFQVDLAGARRLAEVPDFWGASWRELLDAATLYPALQPWFAGNAVSAVVLVAFMVWLARNRRQVVGREAGLARQYVAAMLWLAAGLAAHLAAALGRRGGGEAALGAGMAEALSRAVLHGGALGLLALLCAQVLRLGRTDAPALARDWLRLLPWFVVGVGVVLAPTALAEVASPGWEAARTGVHQGASLALWLLTRLTWLAVLVAGMPRLLAPGRPAQERRLGAQRWRALGTAAARTAAALAPVLVALTALRTLAPPGGLFPGSATALAAFLVGLTVLGAAMVMWLEATQ